MAAASSVTVGRATQCANSSGGRGKRRAGSPGSEGERSPTRGGAVGLEFDDGVAVAVVGDDKGGVAVRTRGLELRGGFEATDPVAAAGRGGWTGGGRWPR